MAADLTVSGAGGLDTGSVQNNGHYAVYVIGDSNGTNNPATLLSLSVDSPIMPSGYDMKRLVWMVVLDGDEIIKFYQTGRGLKRRCWYDYGTNNLRVLDKQSDTSWTDVDCSVYVPSLVDLIHLQVKFETGTKGSAADDVRIRRKGAENSQASPAVGVKSGNALAFNLEMICDDNQMLEYKVDDTQNEVTIVIRGWDLDI